VKSANHTVRPHLMKWFRFQRKRAMREYRDMNPKNEDDEKRARLDDIERKEIEAMEMEDESLLRSTGKLMIKGELGEFQIYIRKIPLHQQKVLVVQFFLIHLDCREI